ncbi:MAG TPA: CsbD family protein [Candidatus Limnocylindria bacterium]
MKDKTEGKWDEAKGKIKEETGKAVGDRSTEISGKMDQAKGHMKEGVGNAKRDLGVDEPERTETPR